MSLSSIFLTLLVVLVFYYAVLIVLDLHKIKAKEKLHAPSETNLDVSGEYQDFQPQKVTSESDAAQKKNNGGASFASGRLNHHKIDGILPDELRRRFENYRPDKYDPIVSELVFMAE